MERIDDDFAIAPIYNCVEAEHASHEHAST